MKLINVLLICFVLSVAITGCKKDDFQSRDTSGLQPDPVVPEPPDPTLVVLDNCDNLTDWEVSGGTQFLETVDKKEGEAAVQGHFKATEDYLHFIKRLSTPVNTNLTAENAQLSFWLYLEKAIEIKEGQVEITSSGQADQQEYHWNVETLGLRPGWNEVRLKVSDAVADNGGANLNAINWFKIYIITKDKLAEEVKVKLDYVRFNAATTVPQTFVSFLNCDVFDEELWEISGGTGKLETQNKKEGTGALFGKTHPGNGYVHFKLKKALTPAVNTNMTFATAQLQFWLYIGKQVPLAGQIEITSSGEPDQQEYNWDVSKITGLKPEAWNLVKLNIRDAGISNGPVNLNAINFFRMYIENTGEDGVDIGIDDIKFASIPPPEPSLFISGDDLNGDWDNDGNMGVHVEVSGKKEGTGYLKGTITGDYFRYAKKNITPPFDTKVTKENGRLTFWLYIERPQLFGEIQVQISSHATDIDANRYGWNLMAHEALGIPPLREGWNEVKLDLSNISYDADGGADLSSLQYFRIFGITTGNTPVGTPLNIGLDGVKFTLK